MAVIRRMLHALLVVTLTASLPLAAAQPPQPQQQDEFVPMTEVPPEEQLPAAPLVVAAYAFAWLAIFVYLLSVARRLTRVQAEITRLEADVQRSARG